MTYAVKMAKYFIAGFFITRLLTIGSEDGQLCIPVQILEFGERGNIACSFQEDYFGVYWYDTQDLTQQPVLHKENGILGGDGYESGKFDLAQDGSLLIRNVTSEYERVFTVMILETRLTENLKHETIEVKVFAYPSVPYPVIDQCMNQQYCCSKVHDGDLLKCTVENSRPPVNLTWIEKTSGGDTDITFNQTHVIKYGLSTSTAVMTYKKSIPPYFGVFVCKAQDNALTQRKFASFTIAELGQPNYILAGVTIKEIKVGSSVSLQCNRENMMYFVWKKAVSQSENHVIAHGYTTAGMKFSENPYEVDSDGLLVILRFTKEQEGLYVCYSGNGVREQAESYLITTGLRATTYITTTSSAATEADNLTTSTERKLFDAIVICIGIIFPFAGLVLLWIVTEREKNVSNKESLVADEESNDTSNVKDHQNDDKEELIETYFRFTGNTVVGTLYETNIRQYEIGKKVSKPNGKMILVLRDNESGKAETIEDLCFHLSDVKKDETMKIGLPKNEHFLTGHHNSNCVSWINIYSTCKTIDCDVTVIDLPISCCSPGSEESDMSKITECLYCLMTNDSAYTLHQIDDIVLLLTNECGAFQLWRLFGKDIRNCIYDKNGDFF